MPDKLHADVLERLQQEVGLSDQVKELVLAALIGEVEECLGGKTPSKPAPGPDEASSPVRAYIDSIVVEGFRGIGPRSTLDLTPGPGLTLVVGRNGSGKSSFAEALELLLTGDNQRWSSKRSKIWKDGWRNLHAPDATRIEAKLLIDGQPGPYLASRQWNASDTLEAGEATIAHDGKSSPLSQLGWATPLVTYRPFLSYNELGSMLEEGPSKLFDALASILGLEELVTAADALKEARASRSKIHKKAKDTLKELRASLDAHGDERAAKCLDALKGSKWKLDIVENLVAGGAASQTDPAITRLRELTQIQGPNPDRVSELVTKLRSAINDQQSVAGTDADKARRRADILDKALELHRHDGDGDCPVCGRSSALNEAWHQQAEEQAQELRKEAEAAEQAHHALRQAEQTARAMATPPPASLSSTEELGVDADAAQVAWNAWHDGATATGEELAKHLETQAPDLNLALELLREQAQQKLQAREDLWRPMALALAEWLPSARQVQAETDTIKHLKAAEDWVRTTATAIRNERFQPIKEKVKAIWELLRTRSNVELEDVTFEGKTTSRKVSLDVTVDGTQGAALGVMSQGELHSLALALFLPRATLDASPFRFLVIDDPVQSMDPARVDGLAKVLGEVANDRQVVVFTHDDRLPDAVRRLSVPAKIIEVLRREGSVVELREVRSPMRQYLDDAFALASTKDLPKIARERVVPPLCRHSLEAVCIDVVRRRRLTRGDSHQSVEELFETHRKLMPRLALALFDDAEKTGEVYKSLKNRVGPWQVDTVKLCNEGAHKGFPGDDPLSFVRNVEKLAGELVKLS
jgi:recombinational DNA repair ATPase RecF/uncharacterized Zn finger protein (UPF0148 family)